MKKFIILAIMFLVSFNMNATSTKVYLQYQVSAHDDNLGNPLSRCPTVPMILEQNHNKLYLPYSTDSIIVKLSVKGTVLYSETVLPGNGNIDFPKYFQGEYDLSLLIEEKEYVGVINF